MIMKFNAAGTTDSRRAIHQFRFWPSIAMSPLQKIQSFSEIVNGMTNPRITPGGVEYLDGLSWIHQCISSGRGFLHTDALIEVVFPETRILTLNVASKTTRRKLIRDNGYHLRGRWVFLRTFDTSPSRLAEKCDHRAVCVHQHLPGSVYTGWLLAERHGLWVRAIFARERCTTNEQFHF